MDRMDKDEYAWDLIDMHKEKHDLSYAIYHGDGHPEILDFVRKEFTFVAAVSFTTTRSIVHLGRLTPNDDKYRTRYPIEAVQYIDQGYEDPFSAGQVAYSLSGPDLDDLIRMSKEILFRKFS